jgi:cytochrome P450
MRESWGSSGKLADPGRDALRLGLNVITGAAYGCQLAWEGSPPSALNSKQEGGRIPFAEAVESFTAHLMPYFLTPKWWLRLAPADSAAGRARTAYAAFGGYMRGMLAAERERMDDGQPSENLLTALLDAQEHEDKEGRRLPDEEVLGNAFIFLFAGHETTANTLHYSLLQLAAHPIAQEQVLAEIDAMRSVAAAEGRPLAYEDFGRARWLMAVMNETLRMYTPTSMVHKWTDAPAPITVGGQAYVLPAQTRISINCTGVHANPAVWGVDADTWKPERWIVPAGSNLSVSIASTPVGTLLPTPMLPEIVVERSTSVALARKKMAMLPTPPATPVMSFFAAQASSPTESTSTISRRDSASSESSTSSSSSSSMSLSPKSSLKPTLMPSSFTTSLPTWNMPFGSITPPDTPLLASSASNAVPSPPSSPTLTQIPLLQTPSVVQASSTRQAPAHWDTIDVLRPAKGTFLPFSEGSRACSGRKFAAVEFVSALCALLSDQRVTLDESAGWTSERLEKSLKGRKAGALTLQPPEVVPLVFTPREAKV